MERRTVARHHVVEFEGCDPKASDSRPILRLALTALCRDAGLHPVGRMGHRFAPHGLTVLWILKESHLAYSSWPEHRYAVLDLFLCGPVPELGPALSTFARALGAERLRRRELPCGFTRR